MKVWFNRMSDSRRSVVEVSGDTVSIGRDATNHIVLDSPLVSRRHVIVRRSGNQLELENVGTNSCLVGETEVNGGGRLAFGAASVLRIWPYSVTFELDGAQQISRQQFEAHLRNMLADLELRIHRTLLERLDLLQFESGRGVKREMVLLLENNIDDICRELSLFDQQNEAVLDGFASLSLRDLLMHQLIVEAGERNENGFTATSTEFDIPATLVPEREAEATRVLGALREKLGIPTLPDISSQVRAVDQKFADEYAAVRARIHPELRKYLTLRLLKKDLKDIVFGFGPLQDLLRAPTISEIMVVRSDQIYVERDGVIENSGRRFLSDEVTLSVIERIVAQVGRRIDKSQPMVDARLPDGSRINAIIPPLAVSGPCLTIRKFPLQSLSIDSLIETGSLTQAVALFLRACVINRRNVLVSGGTGSGKTTMLNILSGFIPNKERIVTIEDTAELRMRQEHVVSLESKQANVEGIGAYTIRDLVRNSLRMRPDRIIVGECRGGEALDMVQAMNTGHDGSMTTVHANSSAEVVERLEVLMLMAADLPMESIHRQIGSAIDLIVHLDRLPGGGRMVTQVSEVTGTSARTGRVGMIDIFNRRQSDRLMPTGYLPTFVPDLIQQRLLEPRFLYGPDAAKS
jgi:Flp pilus assembly CpaF family ATPase